LAQKFNQSKGSIFITELCLVALPFEGGQLMLPSEQSLQEKSLVPPKSESKVQQAAKVSSAEGRLN
jgi:hypothetical protein